MPIPSAMAAPAEPRHADPNRSAAPANRSAASTTRLDMPIPSAMAAVAVARHGVDDPGQDRGEREGRNASHADAWMLIARLRSQSETGNGPRMATLALASRWLTLTLTLIDLGPPPPRVVLRERRLG